jgi:hypothetical protein
MIGASIVGLPVWRMSGWSRGATGDRSNAVDVVFSLAGRPDPWQVIKNLTVLKLSGMLG